MGVGAWETAFCAFLNPCGRVLCVHAPFEDRFEFGKWNPAGRKFPARQTVRRFCRASATQLVGITDRDRVREFEKTRLLTTGVARGLVRAPVVIESSVVPPSRRSSSGFGSGSVLTSDQFEPAPLGVVEVVRDRDDAADVDARVVVDSGATHGSEQFEEDPTVHATSVSFRHDAIPTGPTWCRSNSRGRRSKDGHVWKRCSTRRTPLTTVHGRCSPRARRSRDCCWRSSVPMAGGRWRARAAAAMAPLRLLDPASRFVLYAIGSSAWPQQISLP